MSSLSKNVLEIISNWAEVLTVGLALGSAFCGVVLVLVNKPLKIIEDHESQEERRKFEIELETQKGETAKAQTELLRLQQQRLPRTLKFDSNESLQALTTSLKQKPFTAEISYKNGDGEASWFAQQVWGLLLSAGWKVPHPTAIPEDLSANPVERLKAQPLGVTLITKKSSDHDKPDDPEAILMNLLSKSLGTVARSPDANLPANSVRIIILQKP